MDPRQGPRRSAWEAFLREKTTAQRFILAVGGIAGAILSIVGVATALTNFLDSRSRSESGEVVVENQSREADDLVRMLLAASDAKPLVLDHKVIAPRGNADVALEYDCTAATGCSTVRLQDPQVKAGVLVNGLWFKGCWSAHMDGNGYATQALDIELTRRGETCP